MRLIITLKINKRSKENTTGIIKNPNEENVEPSAGDIIKKIDMNAKISSEYNKSFLSIAPSTPVRLRSRRALRTGF
jgi:hypothetical protein